MLGARASLWAPGRNEKRIPRVRHKPRPGGRPRIEKGKECRAHEGCLGSRRRRRTRQAAKSRGEEQISLDPRTSEWGNPPRGSAAPRRMRGANPGNRNIPVPGGKENNSDCASSGERKRKGPNRGRRGAPGVVGPPAKREVSARGTRRKAGPQRVRAPYPKARARARRHLSSAGHEESGANPRGPSRKAEYYRETDSEPVP